MTNAPAVDIRWVAGIAGTWLGLTVLLELGAPEFAAALAALIAVGSLAYWGAKGFGNVQGFFNPAKGTVTNGR